MQDKNGKFNYIFPTNNKKDVENHIYSLFKKDPHNEELAYWKAFISLNFHNDTDESFEILKALLEKDKNNKTYLNLMGNIYLLKENPDKALEYYQKVSDQYGSKLVKEEDCVFSLSGLITVYILQKDKKNSNKTHPKLLKLFNNDKTLILEHANKVKNNKNYIEALKLYDSLFYKNKKDVMVNLSKADLYEKMEDIESAIKTYDLVLNERLDNIGALNKQGLCLINNNEIDKGESNFNKVLTINSKNTEALYGLAYSKYKQKKFDDALEYYNKTLNENPYHRQALLGKAEILKRNKDYTSLLETYNKLLENDKSNIEALIGKAETYHTLKEYTKELEVLDEVLKLKKDDTGILKMKVKSLFELKEYSEALNICDTILSIDDSDKEALKLRKRIDNKINSPSLLGSIKSKLGF